MAATPVKNSELTHIVVTNPVNLDTLALNTTSLVTLSGMPATSTTLGTFTGSTIDPNVTVKAALQSLVNAVEAIDITQLNLAASASSTQVIIDAGPGTNAVIGSATGTNAGIMLPAHFTKLSHLTVTSGINLDDIPVAKLEDFSQYEMVGRVAAGDGPPIKLSRAQQRESIGITITDNTNVITTAQVNKLAGIAAGATVNSTDATLLNRANHTGSQPSSTISDFATAAACDITLTPSDTQIQINSSTGADAIMGLATSAGGTNLAGLMSPTQFDSLITQNQALSDVVALSGRDVNSTHLGQFSGTTIDDNLSIKAALQQLETVLEGVAGGGITNLDVIKTASQITVTSDTGTDAVLPLATATGGTNEAGLMSPTQVDSVALIGGLSTTQTALVNAKAWLFGSDYELVGDDATSNNTAMVNALTAANSAGRALFIKAGVYRITSGWSAFSATNLTLIGEPGTIIKFTGSYTSVYGDGSCFVKLASGGSLRVRGVGHQGWNSTYHVPAHANATNYNAVRVATTGAIVLSGLQTIDGVYLGAGERVLVKNQATTSTNGIYVTGTGAWTRATDLNSTWAATIYVLSTEGDTNRGKIHQSSVSSGTVGTTSVTFTAPYQSIKLVDVQDSRFEMCVYGVGTQTDWNQSNEVEMIDRVVFRGNTCKTIYCAAISIVPRYCMSTDICHNEIDCVTVPPWYTSQQTNATVRVVSVTNITLSGTQTVDGVSLAVNDRVLVTGQTDTTTNGIYVVQSGAWTRATDLNSTFPSQVFTKSSEGSLEGPTGVGGSYPGALWRSSVSSGSVSQAHTWDRLSEGRKHGIRVQVGYPQSQAQTGIERRRTSSRICHNVIRDIRKIDGHNDACSGIHAGGAFIDISHNHVEEVNSASYNNCEGIYTKIRLSMISHNTCINAGHAQGMITLKGYPEDLEWWATQGAADFMGYGTTISHNRIVATDAKSVPRWGISVWSVGSFEVLNNHIEGVTLGILQQPNGQSEFNKRGRSIRFNHIRNLVSYNGNFSKTGVGYVGFLTGQYAGVMGISGSGDWSQISDNLIENLVNTRTDNNRNCHGIWLVAYSEGTNAHFYTKIERNLIRNMTYGSGGYSAGIENQNGSQFKRIHIRDNVIDGVFYGALLRSVDTWTGSVTDNEWTATGDHFSMVGTPTGNLTVANNVSWNGDTRSAAND